MKSSQSLRLLLVLLLGGVLLMVCVASVTAVWLVTRTISRDQVAASESLSNRIAFVGNDGNLWLATPDGKETKGVTSDGKGYRFPAWAPDGRHLAFIGPGETGNVALYGYNADQPETSILFNSPESAPFYIYWSPDSRAVTFLTQERSSMAMRLADVENPEGGRVMAKGAPFYWVWSPQADQVLMHVGGSGSLSEEAHLSLLENKEGAHRVELGLAPGSFQAPVWTSSGRFIFCIAADGSDREAIYKIDMETSVQTYVTPLNGPTFFVLSPDDQHIAYLQLQRAGQFSGLGAAYIVDTDGGDRRQLLEDWVTAMYWSPDGKKLAVLTVAQGGEDPIARAPGSAAPLAQPGRLRWWVYDLETDTLESLMAFVPTLDFVQTLPFFDQYHLSLTFWSPDSRYLVFTRRDSDVRGDTVWVLDTTGQQGSRQIGNGTFAVWSWQ